MRGRTPPLGRCPPGCYHPRRGPVPPDRVTRPAGPRQSDAGRTGPQRGGQGRSFEATIGPAPHPRLRGPARR
ncbi:hypothetical protein FTX61_02940 [Nitriliruptoraceae bacterium ZYF776]|nr:hypothetical protein [Profundirhabdus halotolerans]